MHLKDFTACFVLLVATFDIIRGKQISELIFTLHFMYFISKRIFPDSVYKRRFIRVCASHFFYQDEVINVYQLHSNKCLLFKSSVL